MNRYMSLTGHDSTALVIDTQAPLDVLYDAAAAVTQFLENLAFREEISSDALCCMISRCCWLSR